MVNQSQTDVSLVPPGVGGATSAPPREPTRIRSVERAAKLMGIVASLPAPQRTARELASRLGTPLATTYHLLNTLVDVRLLTRDEHRRYHLGLATGALGAAYYRQAMAPPELLGPLGWLVERTGEDAYLSDWRHGELEILAHVAGTHAVGVTVLKPGFHGFAHARASGKVLLAFAPAEARRAYLSAHPLEERTRATIIDRARFLDELEEVAKRGYAVDEEEFCEGVGGIAAPILDGPFLLGAYTVSSPIERHRELFGRYLDEVLAAARRAVTRPASGAMEGMATHGTPTHRAWQKGESTNAHA